MELCKYCKEKEAIKNSHVIPSFVFKWIKDTSPTGYLRATNEPNRRAQDGYKSPLLCLDCESKFSEVENAFKKETFTKIANYREPAPDVLPITESTRKCIYIIAWRTLADAYYFPKDNQYTKEEFDRFPQFLEEVKKKIEGEESSNFRSHLIPCVKDVLLRLNLPKVEWFYYERAAGAEPRIWDNWERFLIYIKIPFAIVVFEIVPNANDLWQGTQIDAVNEIELAGISACPDYVAAQIEHFYNSFLESKEQVTESQQEKMRADIEKANPDCGSFKSMNKTWDE